VKIAFPTDEHRPYHDRQAVELALEIVRDFDPDLLIAGSDALDFYSISPFDKNPARVKADLQHEIEAWKAGQREWQAAAPRAARPFIPGNHEDRLRRYLWQHPEIAGLEALRLENLLAFDEFGITWDGLPASEVVVDGRFVFKHGSLVRKFSGGSARAELENERHSLSGASGHTHRGGAFHTRTRGGLVSWYEGFCLCSLEPEYVTRPDWQQGILLVTVENETVSAEPIPFQDLHGLKVAHWRGKEYLA
jgi:hypothetical protein